MTSNIEKLGETLQGRMHTVKKSSSSALIELGTISSALALEPDQSPGPIPEGDYSICRTVSDKVMKKKKGCHWQRVYGGHPLSKIEGGRQGADRLVRQRTCRHRPDCRRRRGRG